jgi:hypothetical protein
MVRTNGRGEIEDDEVVEVEHPKKRKDASRSGNDSKSGRSQMDQFRSNRSVRSINK